MFLENFPNDLEKYVQHSFFRLNVTVPEITTAYKFCGPSAHKTRLASTAYSRTLAQFVFLKRAIDALYCSELVFNRNTGREGWVAHFNLVAKSLFGFHVLSVRNISELL